MVNLEKNVTRSFIENIFFLLKLPLEKHEINEICEALYGVKEKYITDPSFMEKYEKFMPEIRLISVGLAVMGPKLIAKKSNVNLNNLQNEIKPVNVFDNLQSEKIENKEMEENNE